MDTEENAMSPLPIVYKLSSIDDKYTNVDELGSVLQINTKKVVESILNALRVMLMSKVGGEHGEKRRRLLEALFPYGLLENYKSAVQFLLAKEDDIPDSIINTLLQDSRYNPILVPAVKLNIYRKRRDYFKRDIDDTIRRYVDHFSTEDIIASRSLASPEKTRALLHKDPYDFTVLNTALKEMVKDHDDLATQLFHVLLDRIIELSSLTDYDAIQMNCKVIVGYIIDCTGCVLPLAQYDLDNTEMRSANSIINNLINLLKPMQEREVRLSDFEAILKYIRENGTVRKRIISPPPAISPPSLCYRECICAMIAADTELVFVTPVDITIVPDYYQHIQKPMDLSTMLEKCEQYSSPAELRSDIELICSNCIRYNGLESAYSIYLNTIRKAWDGIMAKMEDKVRNLSQGSGSTSNSVSSDSLYSLTSLLLLVTSVFMTSPAVESKLLRCILEYISTKATEGQMIGSHGVLEPPLYRCYSLFMLYHHMRDIVNDILKKETPSSWDIRHVCDYKSYDDIPKENYEFILYIHLTILHSLNDTDVDFEDDCVEWLKKSTDNHRLLYEGVCYTFNHINTNTNTKASYILILKSFLRYIMRLDDVVLRQEWSSLCSIVVSLLSKPVSTDLYPVISSCFFLPLLQKPGLFSTTLELFMNMIDSGIQTGCLHNAVIMDDCNDLGEKLSVVYLSNAVPFDPYESSVLGEGMIEKIRAFTDAYPFAKPVFLHLFKDVTVLFPDLQNENLPPQATSVKRAIDEISGYGDEIISDGEDDFF